MSRHHILPPIVYTPEPPKPNETRRRRGVGSVYGKPATDETEDETEDASDLANTGPLRNSPLPQNQTPVEAAERRIPSTTGHLSEDTLKALLEAQEDEGG